MSRPHRDTAARLGAGLLLVAALSGCGTRSASSGDRADLSPTFTATAIAIPGNIGTGPLPARASPRPTGSADGTVTDASGRLVAGLPVHATSTTDPSQPMPAPYVTTDARGRYTWADLPPGPYAVTVTSGATHAAGQVTVSVGSSTRLDLVLR